MACAFYDRLIREGKSEQVASQLTSAYILGRLRKEKSDGERFPWEDAE